MAVKRLKAGPMKFDALQVKSGNFTEIEEFVGGDAEYRDGKYLVAGPEGPLWANEFDWITKQDVSGHFFVWSHGTIKSDFVEI